MDPAIDFALPAFIISIVGLVLAAIGTASGLAAFIWQIRTRTLGAHRVRVNVRSNNMLLSVGDEPLGPFIVVEIVNVGAASVQVSGWIFVMPDGSGLYALRAPAGVPSTSLPHTLAPGSKTPFFALSSEIAKHTRGIDESKMRVRVELATGQVILSKRGLVRTSQTKG